MEKHIRRLRQKGDAESRSGSAPLPSLTISRQCGAGLARIERPLLDYLDHLGGSGEPPWALFDQSIIGRVIEENRLPRGAVPFDAGRTKFPVPSKLGENLARPTEEWNFFNHSADALRSLCEAGHAIVVGRAGNFVASDLENTFHLRLVADKGRRIAYAGDRQGLDRPRAAELVEETDKARARFVERNTGGDIGDPVGYHLVVTTDHFPDEILVRVLGDALHEWSQHRGDRGRSPNGKIVPASFL